MCDICKSPFTHTMEDYLRLLKEQKDKPKDMIVPCNSNADLDKDEEPEYEHECVDCCMMCKDFGNCLVCGNHAEGDEKNESLCEFHETKDKEEINHKKRPRNDE